MALSKEFFKDCLIELARVNLVRLHNKYACKTFEFIWISTTTTIITEIARNALRQTYDAAWNAHIV